MKQKGTAWWVGLIVTGAVVNACVQVARSQQPSVQEVRNILAAMPESKVPILMSEFPSTWLTECPDCVMAMAQKTGTFAVDFNVHPRSGVGEAWTIGEDVGVAVALAHRVSRQPLIVAAYSPYLGYENGLDPATVSLSSLRRFTVYGNTLDAWTSLDIITIIDSERFKVDRDDKYVALVNTHNARIDTIHNAFYDVGSSWGDVLGYAFGSTLESMTWRERRISVDAQAFRPYDPDFWHEMVEVCIKRMNAEERLTLVTCHVACGAGFNADMVWQRNLDIDPDITRAVCRWLTDQGVQIVMHPNPLNTEHGVRDLWACIEGVNLSVLASVGE